MEIKSLIKSAVNHKANIVGKAGESLGETAAKSKIGNRATKKAAKSFEEQMPTDLPSKVEKYFHKHVGEGPLGHQDIDTYGSRALTVEKGGQTGRNAATGTAIAAIVTGAAVAGRKLLKRGGKQAVEGAEHSGIVKRTLSRVKTMLKLGKKEAAQATQ
ncbi:MAG: hypothetical protein AB7P76_05050 [Candidatus Melainabacteria bacterium]